MVRSEVCEEIGLYPGCCTNKELHSSWTPLHDFCNKFITRKRLKSSAPELTQSETSSCIEVIDDIDNHGNFEASSHWYDHFILLTQVDILMIYLSN